jgi:hypothetical protein
LALTRPNRPRTRSLSSSGKRHHPASGGCENLVRGSRESASEARDENHRQQVHASDGKAGIKQHRSYLPDTGASVKQCGHSYDGGGAVLRRSAVCGASLGGRDAAPLPAHHPAVASCPLPGRPSRFAVVGPRVGLTFLPRLQHSS